MFRRRKKASTKAARELVECSPHRMTGGGQIPGLTDNDVEHESPNEHLAISTLALCHDVLSIASQPERLIYNDGDKEHRYVPDFKVRTSFTADSLYIEVKSIGSLMHKEEIDKYGLIASSVGQRGMSLVFLVDAQLEERPRADWVTLLSRYKVGHLREESIPLLLEALNQGPKTVTHLIAYGHDLADIWTLIARRRLCIDWERPFKPLEALVSLPNKPFRGLHLEDILGSGRFGSFLGQLALGCRTADQRLMAAAQTWRQLYRPPGPFSNVGGYCDELPLCPHGSEELRAAAARYGNDPAIGLSIAPPIHTK